MGVFYFTLSGKYNSDETMLYFSNSSGNLASHASSSLNQVKESLAFYWVKKTVLVPIIFPGYTYSEPKLKPCEIEFYYKI